MSIYITFDETAGEQVASNKGWGDFCRWVETLKGDGPLDTLTVNGECSGISNLVTDLSDSLTSSPPEDPTVLTTAKGLLDLLSRDQGQEIVLVTDGTGP